MVPAAYPAASFDGSAVQRQLKLHNRIPHRRTHLGNGLVLFMLTGGNNGVPEFNEVNALRCRLLRLPRGEHAHSVQRDSPWDRWERWPRSNHCLHVRSLACADVAAKHATTAMAYRMCISEF